MSSIITTSAVAQVRNEHTDSLLSRWVIDVNLLGGMGSQDFTTANTTANYPNGLNMNTGKLKYENGSGYGADAQLGFFFGKKRHFGVGAGFMYLGQQGNAVLNGYHVEYQATDAAGNVYRQLITGNNVKENITSTNYNIPLVLKYKDRFSKHWGIAVDAGVMFNLQTMNAYNSHANFDYEALYQFAKNGDGANIAVYDNSPTPSSSDLMITKAEFLKNNPNGNIQSYFNAERAAGFNVGLGKQPINNKGNVYYTKETVGFMAKPSINYFLSDNVALDFGLFYIYQPFKTTAQNGYRLTDGINGTYSSVLNTVTSVTNQVYGVNFGARFFLGRKRTPLSISSTDQRPPSQCGLSDGSILLKGLKPDQSVTVNYSLNDTQPSKMTVIVPTDGTVIIPNLSAGNYTGIVATTRRKSTKGTDITLSDPAMSISSQNPVNPTLSGKCDGAVTFNGLYAGRIVSINYSLNGSSQLAFTGTVNADNSITMTGLCEGSYTGITVVTNNCTAKGTDFTLTVPQPPLQIVPAPISTTVVGDADISEPILFNSNMSTVHKDSYHLLDEAADELKGNKGATITIDGNADTTGSESFNRVLSLRRANSVKEQLVKRGVSSKRLKAKGHGSTIPAATNTTVEGRGENRRAVMKLQTTKKPTIIAELP